MVAGFLFLPFRKPKQLRTVSFHMVRSSHATTAKKSNVVCHKVTKIFLENHLRPRLKSSVERLLLKIYAGKVAVDLYVENH